MSKRFLVQKIEKIAKRTKDPRFRVVIAEPRGGKVRYYGDCVDAGEHVSLTEKEFERWARQQSLENDTQIIILTVDKRAAQTALGTKEVLYFAATDWLATNTEDMLKRYMAAVEKARAEQGLPPIQQGEPITKQEII